MKKRGVIIVSLFLALALSLAAPGFARADGMIVSPPSYSMYESGQRAVLFYEEAAQQETLVVSMQFRGNAKDFAWIIPTPNKPTVSRGSAALFTSLDVLTGGGYTVMPYKDLSAGRELETPTVRVENRQTIDYYDVTTLAADNSAALTGWLNTNGYFYPASSAYIFNSYVSAGWHFVAVKINAESAGLSSVTESLREGNAAPLKLVFTAKNPVYPLRISSVMSDVTAQKAVLMPPELQGSAATDIVWRPDTVPVELFVIAEHKKDIPGFSTRYGNWVKRSAIESWAVDEQGDALIAPQKGKYFLTKLTRQMTYSQMTDDLFPKDAKDNKKAGLSSSQQFSLEKILIYLVAVSTYTALVFFFGIFSPFGIAFIIATVLYIRARSRAARVAAWTIQSIVGVFYALVALGLVFVSLQNADVYLSMPRSFISGSSDSTTGSLWALTLILPLAAFMTLLILVMVFQRRWRNKQRQPVNDSGMKSS